MRPIFASLLLICLLAAVCNPIRSVAADASAAIVMSVRGEITPSMRPMTEIAAGSSIRLAPGVELTFLRYTRRKLVTAAAGELRIGNAKYETSGKNIKEENG